MKRLVSTTAVGLAGVLLMPLWVVAQPPRPAGTDAPADDPTAAATTGTTVGYCLSYRAPAGTSAATLEAAADTLDVRLGSMGVAGDATADAAGALLRVELTPGPEDLAAARELAVGLGVTGAIEFLPVPDELQGMVDEGPLPEGMQGVEPLFDNTRVAFAEVATDPSMGEAVVYVELDDEGARLLDAYAEEHFGEQFAIVLDDEVIWAPVIQATRFGGEAQISGGADGLASMEPQAVAAALLSGALPVELSLEEVSMCDVPADLVARTPQAVLARAGADLEVPAALAATRLRDVGIEDFVITLHPETDRITATILSTDPALVTPVEAALTSEWFPGDVLDLDFVDTTLDDYLASLPDQPVALHWSDETPDGTEWQSIKGALIGDPSDLGAEEPTGVDVGVVVETWERWEAFDALFGEITADPRFVGYSGSEDGTPILLFARDSIPKAAIEELSGYGVPLLSGTDVTEIRGAEIDLTLGEVQEIRDTLADILAEHGLAPEDTQISFYQDQKPEAFIDLADPDTRKSIRQAVKDRLGKGVLRLTFIGDGSEGGGWNGG